MLAGAGRGARREREQWIAAGRVSVNGEPATVGMRVSAEDRVQVDGRPVRLRHDEAARVLLYHKPTGIVIKNQESRSQGQNKENAIRLLKSKLFEMEMRKRMETVAAIEGNKKKIEWGSQIRNYVMHPYKLVKDLRTDYETSSVQAVITGDLNEFSKYYLKKCGKNTN